MAVQDLLFDMLLCCWLCEHEAAAQERGPVGTKAHDEHPTRPLTMQRHA